MRRPRNSAVETVFKALYKRRPTAMSIYLHDFMSAVGYTIDTVRLTWMNSSVDIAEDMTLPQFTYEGHQLRDCSVNYTSGKLKN